MKEWRKVALTALVFFLFVGSSFAEIDFKTGAYLRLRHEFWKNIFDLENTTKDNRNYFRVKASVWGELGLTEDIKVYAKLTDEFKSYTYWLRPNGKKGERFDINEVVFDNLYVDITNFAGLPVDLRVGRQNFVFTYGEGFLIMDGTPLDGSRTFYFNAAKASWRVNEENTLDVVYINNPRDDHFLPVINQNHSPQALNITDETAYMLYLKNASVENLPLEVYYIFKTEDDDNGVGLQAQNTYLHTIGSFAKYNFSPYTLRGQLAYQFGDYGANDRQGIGGYIFLDRKFEDTRWSPKASAGFVYLSGDDTSTDTNEGWDPLFSRWPWISELYALTYNAESGLGYRTNLQMWRTEVTVAPTEKMKLSVWYNFLRANETPVGTFSSGSGKNRGHLPQIKLSYKISKNVSTYFLVEYFIPGNFHDPYADDVLFLRSELTFKF